MSELTQKHLKQIDLFSAHHYKPLPIVLSKGKGSQVWDIDGKEYIDFLSCYSALNFGHQHPELVETLKNQLDKIAVVSRAFQTDNLGPFSEELAAFCQKEMVLPMNSGAEAVETAVKLARIWAYTVKKVPENKAKILVAANNFHGRTLSVISFSSEPLYRKNFGPFTPGFEFIHYNDLESVKKAIDSNTAAILLEPLQAEAGVILPKQGFLKEVYSLCRQNNILFIADEIQTGLGRTGKRFCVEHEGIVPDVFILGKALGGGLLPISAVVSNRDILGQYTPGTHGSTFGGNPLACAVARVALKILVKDGLIERSHQLGNKVLEKLKNVDAPEIKEIRGKGLLIGIEMKPEANGARRYCEALAQKGVLCKETHEHVIRIAPPLNIEETLLWKGVDTVIQTIRELRN